MLGAYIGVIGFFVLLGRGRRAVTGTSPDRLTLGALIDPFGIGAIRGRHALLDRQLTATRACPRSPALLLLNRSSGSASARRSWGRRSRCSAPIARGCAWRRARGPAARRSRRSRSAVAERGAARAPVVVLRTGSAARWAQFLWLARFETRAVLLAHRVPDDPRLRARESGERTSAFSNEMFGTKVLSRHALDDGGDGRQLQFPAYSLLSPSTPANWCGASVAARISDVTDAFPLPDWIPLAAKLTALAAVIVIFLAAGSVECALVSADPRLPSHTSPGCTWPILALTALEIPAARSARAISAGDRQQQVPRLSSGRAVPR